MSKRLLSAAVLGFAVVSTGALAVGPEYEARAVVVPFGDVDISRESGAEVLLKRIRSASDQACSGRPFVLELKAQQAYVDCKSVAVEEAVIEVDAPMLTALYQRGGGRIGVVTVTEGYYPADQTPVDGNITMEPIPNP